MTPEEKRESHKNAQKKWLEKNREYQSEYREKNKEKLRAYQKEWRANHPERVKEILQKYYDANRVKQRERYKIHREEHLVYYRKYNIDKGIENQRTDYLLNRQDDLRILMFEDIEDNRLMAEIDVVMEYSIKWYGEEKL